MDSRVRLGLGIAFSCLLISSVPARGEEINFGPIYHTGPLTLDNGTRTEILGPLFTHNEKGSEESWILRPLGSYQKDSLTDTAKLTLAYPLMSYSRYGLEYRFQFLQVISWAGGVSLKEQANHRVTIFPFYFQQRSQDSNLNYTAFFPIYGQLKNRLFRDEVDFALFPLYMRSLKKDVVTDNFLFPIIHRRHGTGLTGWQVWPLFGTEHKNASTVTNGFDETETIAGHDKKFALWPLYFKDKLGIGTENPESHQVLLPFYSWQRSPLRDSSTYLWPFGLTYTDDRDKKYREWDALWPLIVFARGEGKTALRIWPLFGRAKNETLESDFYLWPFYKYNRATSSPLDRERTRLLFFLYSHLVEKNTTTGTALDRTDLWPLLTRRRDHDGNERLQVLSVLDPLLPNNQTMQLNYASLCSVWSSESNAKTGAASQSFLWNLYRRDTTSLTKKCSLLFGCFQYQSGPEGRLVRLFYIPLGKPKKDSESPRTVSISAGRPGAH